MSEPEWTFMVYMAGDNNLSSAGDNDLEEMRRVGSTDAVNVVVQFDNAGDNGTRRFHVQRDGANERVVSLGETDSGDPAVLLDFVEWASREYPANRYALVLWNHGSGWRPEELDRIARTVESPGYTGREISERAGSPLNRTLFRTTFERVFALPGPTVRAICSDDGTGHSLDTIELGRVLEQAKGVLGGKIDLLGMDACLMSNLEVAYQVTEHVGYVVASEETEPNDGWPYDRILGRLVANPHLPTSELATQIVVEYVESYADAGDAGPITQAALDLSKLAEVVTPVDALAAHLRSAMGDMGPLIWQAQRRSAGFLQHTLWDLAHFTEELESIATDPQAQELLSAVRNSLVSGEDRFVVAEGHLGDTVAKCGGLTVYLPPIAPISPYYSELAFASGHAWLPMLQSYKA